MEKSLKPIRLFIIFGFFMFLSCSKQENLEFVPVKQICFDTIKLEHSLKGWELYSWPNGDDWNYSLLVGTNVIKSYEKIVCHFLIVRGTDSLEMMLAKLPANEEITWIGKTCIDRRYENNSQGISFPGSNVINEIKRFSMQKELNLALCN
jgi:hypothetical protein